METVLEASALITTRMDIVMGFQWQAQEKARRANDFHAIAEHFISRVEYIDSVDDLINDQKIYQFSLGASALSAKGARQLGPDLCRRIIEASIDLDRLSDSVYVEELERRYLLTCGDALGGAMRNAIGQRAQIKFSDSIVSYLQNENIPATVIRNNNEKITQISWENRVLVFDRKPRFIAKNIDFILLDSEDFDLRLLEDANKILACGELKGGIDPAGADEHWKTARAALERVRNAFAQEQNCPALFFVAAAIEQSMADEIFSLLNSGNLTAAANLHHAAQLTELIRVLVAL